MPSVVQVDEIQNSAGETTIIGGYGVRPGQIIEQLSGPCDGEPVVGLSGTYTWPLVTDYQTTSDSYTDLTGSVISYVPPAQASRVMYELTYHRSSGITDDARSILHYKFYVGNTEVIHARHSFEMEQSRDSQEYFKWIIPIGGTSDSNTGRLSEWTSLKELKLQVRRYNSSYDATFHTTNYFDGSGSNQFSLPTLTITAIA